MDAWKAKSARRAGREKSRRKAEEWPIHGGSLRNPDIASKRRLSRDVQLKLISKAKDRKKST